MSSVSMLHPREELMLSATACPDADHGQEVVTDAAECSTLTHLAKRPAVDIDFHDLSYTVRHGGINRGIKHILRNLNGKFRAGELTAILGPSGAGKSSLLNILFGYVLSGGQRKRLAIAMELVNNPPIIFLDEPTTGLEIFAIKQCVSLLKVLSGQGRTVVCTVHQPNASTLKLFDQLYVLAQGQCVYQGGSASLVPHLSSLGFECPQSYNPADYVMEIIQRDTDNIKTLSAEMQNGKLNKGNGTSAELHPTSRTFLLASDNDKFRVGGAESYLSVEFPTTFFTQFTVLMGRTYLQVTRNQIGFWLQFGHHLISAVLLGGIYYNTGDQADKPYMNFKLSIGVVVFFMYTHVMSPVLLFPDELKMLKREYFNRWYGLKSFYCAYTLSTIPGLVTFGLMFLSMAYLLSGQPLDLWRFCRLAMIGLMIGAASEAYGMIVGSLFSIVNGSIVTPATLSPLLALAVYGMGHGMSIEPVMNFLMSLSYLRYGLVGISTALYGHNRATMRCILPENRVYCHYQDPALLLRDLGMEGLTTSSQMIALVIFYIIFRTMAYLALRFRLAREFSGTILNYAAKVLRH